ncbi:MAG: hypothetical protein KDM64_16695, partial [Verrucomicrobiae bacterium]|nr:hypothetical protein [Verrucomicrobiae bacterium]
HWAKMTAEQSKATVASPEYPAEVRREANEENTGKIFSFTEKLFVYEDYVPDLQPGQVDARTRGFGDLCLVIFNSNEFAYVY